MTQTKFENMKIKIFKKKSEKFINTGLCFVCGLTPKLIYCDDNKV